VLYVFGKSIAKNNNSQNYTIFLNVKRISILLWFF